MRPDSESGVRRIFQTPAKTLRGLHIKATHAANNMLMSYRSIARSALSSPEAAYREAFSEDREWGGLDDEVPLLTIWADLERMLSGEKDG